MIAVEKCMLGIEILEKTGILKRKGKSVTIVGKMKIFRVDEDKCGCNGLCWKYSLEMSVII